MELAVTIRIYNHHLLVVRFQVLLHPAVKVREQRLQLSAVGKLARKHQDIEQMLLKAVEV